tara:strand:+ start:855 stop:1157 length:303 start_codon:yes stop_codon:yes gene_type:complete
MSHKERLSSLLKLFVVSQDSSLDQHLRSHRRQVLQSLYQKGLECLFNDLKVLGSNNGKSHNLSLNSQEYRLNIALGFITITITGLTLTLDIIEFHLIIHL